MLAAAREEVKQERERYGVLEKEHEDLLICLAEQEEEVASLRGEIQLMQSFGTKV